MSNRPRITHADIAARDATNAKANEARSALDAAPDAEHGKAAPAAPAARPSLKARCAEQQATIEKLLQGRTERDTYITDLQAALHDKTAECLSLQAELAQLRAAVDNGTSAPAPRPAREPRPAPALPEAMARAKELAARTGFVTKVQP